MGNMLVISDYSMTEENSLPSAGTKCGVCILN